MKLLIGADLVPTQTNMNLFTEADLDTLLGEELRKALESADLRIFNLEVPLTDKKSPIDKCGPVLSAPTAAIAGYKALGVDLVTIANNHIMDHGEQGLRSTISILKENKINYVGSGMNLMQASEPQILTCFGKKIGVYACAEKEFSIAGETKPGANPFDPLESPDHVAALKAQCDYVIVLYHGGKEHYRYPSPNLQKVCRKLVEKGADLVLCQHSHCIGCEEKYLNGTIVYGQGNFLFDHNASEYWQTGLLVQIRDEFSVSYVPIVKRDNVVRLAREEEAKEIMDAFFARSKEIEDPAFLQERYRQHAGENLDRYLLMFAGVNLRAHWFRLCNRLTGQRFKKWFLARKYGKKKLLVVLNTMECQAHSELACCGIEDALNK